MIIICATVIILFFLINAISLWLDWAPKLRDNILIIWAIFGFVVMALVAYSIDTAHSQDELSGKLLIDFKEETAVYTESYEWADETVKTTVTVLKSECQSCLDQVNLKDCQELFKICLDIK